VGLQGDVDADVRGDMVALDSRGPAVAPLALQVQVVCTLATYMAVEFVSKLKEAQLSDKAYRSQTCS